MRSYLKVVLSKVGYMLKRETEAQEVKYLILPESLVRDPVFRFPVVPPHYLQRLCASWEPADEKWDVLSSNLMLRKWMYHHRNQFHSPPAPLSSLDLLSPLSSSWDPQIYPLPLGWQDKIFQNQ